MARTTPVGVEIDERVLVAVDLRGECERARRSGQWRGRGGYGMEGEKGEGGKKEGRRDGRTMSRSWETEVTSMIIVVIVVVGSSG